MEIRPRSIYWRTAFLWIVVCIAGYFGALYLYNLFSSLYLAPLGRHREILYIPLSLLLGWGPMFLGAVGNSLFQSLLLRRHLRHPFRWLQYTLTGASIGAVSSGALATVLYVTAFNDPVDTLSGNVVMRNSLANIPLYVGISSGQWWVLREQGASLVGWLAASGGSHFLAGAIMAALPLMFFAFGYGDWAAAALTQDITPGLTPTPAALLVGLLVGIATAVALRTILRRSVAAGGRLGDD